MPLIRAISYYLPETTVTNEQFFERFPEARSTALEKVGVKERHIVGADETASDMAQKAAEKLFEEHGIDRSTIDMLVLCIIEQDHYSPSAGCVLHGKLGLSETCGAIDYNLGCSAYVYGLSVARGFLATGSKNVLLITTSTLTHTFHPRDRSSHFIFGDGAAATLISAESEKEIGPFLYGTDGMRHDRIIIPDGGARNPINEDSHTEVTDEYGNVTSRANLFMDGTAVFLFTMKTVPKLVQDTVAKAGITINDIDLFVFHQANVYINEMVGKKLGIPKEKMVHAMDRFGNTVQNTIPIALYEAEKRGQLKRGMRVLTAGFGAGLSWAATIIEY